MNLFNRVINKILLCSIGRKIPDKLYLKIQYRIYMGKKLNLKNPKSYNEKLQWLKLYNRRKEYVSMADKYDVREYVRKHIGEEYLIPCYGVWERFDDIDFDKLPEQFVLKCTHDSGSVIICKDKSSFDKQKAKEKLERKMKLNLYWGSREWVYRDLKPRI
ncbi:MAG: glycosyl transferase, partial [Clostridia bacterium]|nr:glycosyl transferase [Clostridia bacterium]